MNHVADMVRLRAAGRCERCGTSIANIPASIHHRRPRGMGGTKDPAINTPANCVVLCGSGTTGCHGWVESHRAQAILDGWLVPRRHPTPPGDVPILIHHQYRCHLLDDGTYEWLI